jgi:hypothetical protein
MLSADTNRECQELFLCASKGKASHLTFKFNALDTFDSHNACLFLRNRDITTISFYGDSYMRQIYAAMAITLSGNYRNGSIGDSELARYSGASKNCNHHSQFNERFCGDWEVKSEAIVCNGSITLRPFIKTPFDSSSVSNDSHHLTLFSYGNHPIKGRPLSGGRYGVNNASAYIDLYNATICPELNSRTMHSLSSSRTATGNVSSSPVWWVSTHRRVVNKSPDESSEVVQKFNEDMREFFVSNNCGAVNYLDVYNMTASLVSHHLDAAKALTYDGVHWGMEVNLIKAQMLIDALITTDH